MNSRSDEEVFVSSLEETNLADAQSVKKFIADYLKYISYQYYSALDDKTRLPRNMKVVLLDVMDPKLKAEHLAKLMLLADYADKHHLSNEANILKALHDNQYTFQLSSAEKKQTTPILTAIATLSDVPHESLNEALDAAKLKFKGAEENQQLEAKVAAEKEEIKAKQETKESTVALNQSLITNIIADEIKFLVGTAIFRNEFDANKLSDAYSVITNSLNEQELTKLNSGENAQQRKSNIESVIKPKIAEKFKDQFADYIKINAIISKLDEFDARTRINSKKDETSNLKSVLMKKEQTPADRLTDFHAAFRRAEPALKANSNSIGHNILKSIKRLFIKQNITGFWKTKDERNVDKIRDAISTPVSRNR